MRATTFRATTLCVLGVRGPTRLPADAVVAVVVAAGGIGRVALGWG